MLLPSLQHRNPRLFRCPANTICRLLLVFLLVFLLVTPIGGCVQPPFNKQMPTSEQEILGNVLQLTSGFDRAGEAYFSPDMNWIIFQATPRGQQHYQMYVARLRKQGDEIVGLHPPIRISPENSRNTCGYFSPDGRDLLFASTAGKEDPQKPAAGYQRQSGNYRWAYPAGMELFLAREWQRDLAAAEPGKILDLATHPLTDNGAYDAEGSFSANGRWLVYTSNETGDLELWAMRSDGSGKVQLTRAPGYDGGPFFSPDGSRLVYRSDRKGNDLLQIFVADVVRDPSGGITGLANERRLTGDAHVSWAPFWHPDGWHIVYTTSMHGHTNYELYLMRDDGSRKTRLTFTPGADVLPVFSPDGRYLIWSGKRTSDNTVQIFIARYRMPKGS